METVAHAEWNTDYSDHCLWCLGDLKHGDRLIVAKVNGKLAFIHENCHGRGKAG